MLYIRGCVFILGGMRIWVRTFAACEDMLWYENVFPHVCFCVKVHLCGSVCVHIQACIHA